METDLASQFDRLPPHDLEAEKCLVGSMMIDAKTIDPAVQILGPEPREAFYHADNQIVFDCVLRLHTKKRPIDIISVRDELIKFGLYDEVGGKEYLATLLSTVPSSAHAQHYAAIVARHSMKRKLILIGNDLVRDGYSPNPHDDPADTLHKTQTKLANLITRCDGGELFSIADALQDAYDAIEKQWQGGDGGLIKFGYADLDAIGGGIMPGEHCIIAANPSMGKSTLMRCLALRMAHRGTKVGIISLEESKRKLGQNWLSAGTDIENHLLRKGEIPAGGWEALAAGVFRLGTLPIWGSAKAFTLEAVKSDAARLVSEFGVQVIFVDYLQKISTKHRDRYAAVTAISQDLTTLWKELNVAGVSLAQLSRANQGRPEKRPVLSDLRESGQIEQDADIVVFLHREDYYRAEANDPQRDQIAELIIAKWRDAVRKKTVRLQSELHFQRFVDYVDNNANLNLVPEL